MASSDEGPSASLEIQIETVVQEEAVTEEEQLPLPESSAWSSGFHSRSHSTTPRSRQSSPRAFGLGSTHSSPPPSRSSRLSLHGSYHSLRSGTGWKRLISGLGIPWGLGGSTQSKMKQLPRRKRAGGGGVVSGWKRRRTRGIAAWIGVVAFFFLMNWWMFSRLQDAPIRRKHSSSLNRTLLSPPPATLGVWSKFGKGMKPQRLMYTRLLALAAHALAEGESRPEPHDLWQEPLIPAASWTPCADQRSWETCEGKNGYILISANGGINQQRVAICNAVAIARLLNSTLIVPKFLYSSVWRDQSDIYQEEHFISYLKDDIPIVKELPVELRSLDLEAIGSLVTDTEVMKESKPSFFLKKILPILLKNRVVHFVGFGNRLAFDPVPFELQRLRCRCNFHALRFVSKIQETGALLVRRIRQHTSHWGSLEHNLMGPFAANSHMHGEKNIQRKVSRYLAVHLRFEIDMAAYSLCFFGGGKEEENELEAYREIHFPALAHLRKTKKIPSASFLRSEGRCPLTPEEAVLMLAALGFKRKASVYIAGAHIYGGKSRMAALTSLYPNLATKEDLLSSTEIEPFLNFSSQMAALDFIVCAAADAFAMTDSGSQFSSLISGYRMYYGGGKLPTIRPNKRRLATIFLKNSTIEWREFEERVRKAVKQSKKVHERPIARSIYRHPRCLECMCNIE